MSAPDCVVITLRRRPRLLEQFQRRWARVSDTPVQVFYAHDNRADPVRGCYDSHLEVLAGRHRPVVVFEEDALFSPAFTLDLRPPRPVDLIWLGGQHLSPPITVKEGWVQPTRICRSHAYLANDPNKIAAGLVWRPQRHLDDALNGLDVTQLALSPFTVGQGAGVSTIEGRNYPFHRFWNG